jgi:hypothetical protein
MHTIRSVEKWAPHGSGIRRRTDDHRDIIDRRPVGDPASAIGNNGEDLTPTASEVS